MDNIILYVMTGFAGVCAVVGAVLLVIGLRTRYKEKKNCTMPAVGIVKEIMYDYDTNNRFDDDATPGTQILYGLKLIVNIDGVEHEVFNNEYDSAYKKYRQGDGVNIKINPDDLNEYYIDDGMSAGRFVTLIGIALLVVAGFIIKNCWF